MTQENEGRQRKLKRLWMALAAVAVLLAILIIPPLVSVARYKSRITQLIAASLGRPVRMSSVEVRVLPRPGFVLNDLSVAEDPAFGAEPLLHATSVTAYIRLLPLWRGRLEIGTISVDDASLNLVRTPAGRWNIDPLLRTAAGRSQAAGSAKTVPLPYLEATSSRINIKNGAEKLPFSLIDADLSFWQEKPGDWRVRLRGQPARTDLSLDQADTGIVRLECSMRQAPELRKLPLHVDLQWREAQLGQLTRLVLGTDAGWRGDLTGELHLDGTAETAQVKTRLRASGVHRAEFAPAAPMDFDANCNLIAHFSTRAVENLVCDSPLGSGHIRLTGARPGNGIPPHLSVEVDRIPAAAALDALRTVRRGLIPDMKVAGSISGKMTYAPDAEANATPAPPVHPPAAHTTKPSSAPPAPLTGSFTVEGFQLSGNGLSEPIRIPKLLLEPAAVQPSEHQALTATATIPAGGPTPLTVSTRLALSGYQIAVHGQASIGRAREFAHVSGMEAASALDPLAGEPLQVDLSAEGPWMAPRRPLGQFPTAAPGNSAAPAPDGDTLTGTVTLHNSNWKADYLANHVEISQATLHLEPGQLRWDPVVFSYGPLKGTASVDLPSDCAATQPCLPRVEVQFGTLDASTFQTAVLGAQKPGTLLSTLINRLRPSAAPAWPLIDATLKAESLLLGSVTLRDFQASLHSIQSGAEITGFQAEMLGGKIHGSGTFQLPSSAQGKPAYALEGQFEKLSPLELGKLLGLHWSGGSFDGSGKLDLSGFTGKDLAASAKGALHFEWQHGAAGPLPAALARFDRWVADADVADGVVTLKQNQVRRSGHNATVQATATIAASPKVTFAPDKSTKAKR